MDKPNEEPDNAREISSAIEKLLDEWVKKIESFGKDLLA